MKDHIRERTEKIKYAVGMVVNCRSRQTANYTGVIIWWDKEYNSEVKIAHENIAFNSETQTHPSSVTQPFYTILSENGNTYYAAQGTNKILNAYIYVYFYYFIYICMYDIKKSLDFRCFRRGNSTKMD